MTSASAAMSRTAVTSPAALSRQRSFHPATSCRSSQRSCTSPVPNRPAMRSVEGAERLEVKAEYHQIWSSLALQFSQHEEQSLEVVLASFVFRCLEADHLDQLQRPTYIAGTVEADQQAESGTSPAVYRQKPMPDYSG